MKKQESDAELPLGQPHPTIPGLRLIGWCVMHHTGAAMGRWEGCAPGRGGPLAMFDTRGKARAKATRLGLPHSSAKPCWAEVWT